MHKLVLFLYRIFYKMDRLKIPFLPNLLNKLFIRLLFGCQIGLGAKLGKNILLGYGGLGCVIHHRAVIGDNVNIGSNVTIGGTSKIKEVPVIGNNCIISTGAKIIGPITIGENSVIGANAVVISNIPANSLVVGIPARVVKSNINIEDY